MVSILLSRNLVFQHGSGFFFRHEVVGATVEFVQRPQRNNVLHGKIRPKGLGSFVIAAKREVGVAFAVTLTNGCKTNDSSDDFHCRKLIFRTIANAWSGANWRLFCRLL